MEKQKSENFLHARFVFKKIFSVRFQLCSMFSRHSRLMLDQTSSNLNNQRQALIGEDSLIGGPKMLIRFWRVVVEVPRELLCLPKTKTSQVLFLVHKKNTTKVNYATTSNHLLFCSSERVNFIDLRMRCNWVDEARWDMRWARIAFILQLVYLSRIFLADDPACDLKALLH